MLTTRQQEIWQFLAEYVDAHGYPPTVREIGDAVGLASPSTVHAHLANLERAGLLARDPDEAAGDRARRPAPREGAAARGAARDRHFLSSAGSPPAARSSPRSPSRTRSPYPGRSAGTPTSSCASRATRWSTPGSSTATSSSCAAAGRPRTGEIVVALVGDDEAADEATVKTFHRERDGRIRLQPENAALEPLFPEHVEILGKVTGVFRSLGERSRRSPRRSTRSSRRSSAA